MNKKLYQFQIVREDAPHILAAVDEIDGTSAQIIEVDLDPAKRAKQIKELLAVAKDGAMDAFTAGGRFYFVAGSPAAARKLLSAALTCPSVAVAPVETKRNDSQQDKQQAPGPSRPHGKKPPVPKPDTGLPKWALGGAGLVFLLILIAMVASSSKAAPPNVYQNGNGRQAIYITDETPGAVIYYTTDGSTPTTSSLVYNSPLWELANGTRVRAIAAAQGHRNSDEHSAVYYIPSQFGIVETYLQKGANFYKTRHYAQARRLFRNACNGGEMVACNYLGTMEALGLGGPLGMKNALAHLALACDQGIPNACDSLGSLYKKAGVVTKAREYYQKACDSGLYSSCAKGGPVH